MTLALALAGAAGRMGRALLKAAATHSELVVVGGSEAAGNASLGCDLGVLADVNATGYTVSDTVGEAARDARIWIDFSQPEATLSALRSLRTTKVTGVILGTTGLTADQEAEVTAASEHYAIVYSGNFSLGVNVLVGLVKQAAARLGPDWDIEITEAHHRRKTDAPSGTALLLGQAAADGRDVQLQTHTIPSRWGQTGPRPEGAIGFAIVRAGGIVGEHEVLFGSESEIIRFSHSALDRAIFAKGALRAAVWVADKPPGLYSMADVLGL